MKVNGNHNFKVSREKLWGYLMDPEVLAAITPGITNLEKLGEDEYKSISDIKIGPVKGSFTGKLKVEDKDEPKSFAIAMEQLSKIGNAHVKVSMILEEHEGSGSKLNFDGNAKLSGVIARTGQRVLSGVANSITREVFASLEKYIDEDTQKGSEEAKVEVAESTPSNEIITEEIVEQNKEALSVSQSENKGVFSGILNLLKSMFSSK